MTAKATARGAFFVWRSWYASILFIGLCLLIAFYIARNLDAFRSIISVRWHYILLLLILRVLLLLITGYQRKILYNLFDVHLLPREWFGLAAISAMANLIMPMQAGLATTAAYLKKRHDFPLSRFASVGVALGTLSMGIVSAIGVGATFLYTLRGGTGAGKLAILFILVLASALGVLLLPTMGHAQRNRLECFLNNAGMGMEMIRCSRATIWFISILQVLMFFTVAAALYTSLRALSLDASFLAAVFLGIVGFYGLIIRITPGNLGVQEAMLTIAAGLLGIGYHEGLAMAALFRTAGIIVVFILGPFFSYVLSGTFISSSISSDSDNNQGSVAR